MADPVTFRLEAGITELQVTLRGDVSERIRSTYEDRMRAFVNIDRSSWVRSTIECDWTISGEGQQPYATDDGGLEPVALRLSPTSWWVDWCYYRMAFHPSRSDGVFSDWGPGLEHALRGAAIFGTMPNDALFFHAATLVYDDGALLIAGSPNAGKSTIAREGRPGRVLSNEISIVAERDGEWWALPSPFWGSGDLAARTEAAPLKGLVVLDQSGDSNRWEPLRGATAAAALFPHSGAQAREHANATDVLGAIGRLAGDLPTFSLAWHRESHPLEGSVWRP